MYDWTNAYMARNALADPYLPASELAPIAALHPDLWPMVAAHPAVYPGLLGWMASQGYITRAAPAAQPFAPPATPPAKPASEPVGETVKLAEPTGPPPADTAAASPVADAAGPADSPPVVEAAAAPPHGVSLTAAEGPPTLDATTQEPAPYPPPMALGGYRYLSDAAAQPGTPPPLGAQQYAPLPEMPPVLGAAPPPKRRGVLVAIIAAVALVLAGGGIGIWALARSDADSGTKATSAPNIKATASPGGTTGAQEPASESPEEPSEPSDPAEEPTSTPDLPGGATSAGEVSVVPDADPVAIKVGEVLYNGTADMGGQETVTAGFILTADGKSARDVTISVTGGDFLQSMSISKITQTNNKEFELVDGYLEAELGDGVKLAVEIKGDRAVGTLKYSSEVGGWDDRDKQTFDLGEGTVELEAR